MEFPSHHQNARRVPVRLRTAAVALGQLPGFKTLGRVAYEHCAAVCKSELEALSLSMRVEWRKSFLGTCEPALSDLDFNLHLTSDDTQTVVNNLRLARERYQQLQRRYVIPGEVLVFTPSLSRLFDSFPTPLSWYLGRHNTFSSLSSQLGLAMQFYALAVENLRLAMSHGETSFFSQGFLREMHKALAAIEGNVKVPLPNVDASSLIALFFQRARALHPAASSERQNARDLAEPESTLTRLWLTHFAAHSPSRLSPSQRPFLLRFSDDSSQAVSSAFVQSLRGSPRPMPFLIAPQGLCSVVERGYCGWRSPYSEREAEPQALFEALLMALPNILGAAVYGRTDDLRQKTLAFERGLRHLKSRVPSTSTQLATRPLPERLSDLLCYITEVLAEGISGLSDTLSQGSFGSTVDNYSRGNDGNTSNSKFNSLSQRI